MSSILRPRELEDNSDVFGAIDARPKFQGAFEYLHILQAAGYGANPLVEPYAGPLEYTSGF
jgi:hypothetical protein